MIITPKQKSYALVDSGNSLKLEKFGDYLLIRPEPEAIWQPNDQALWEKADFIFNKDYPNNWQKTQDNLPDSWVINYGGLNIKIKPTSFKHTGLFPEQLSNWEYLENITKGKKDLKILNLFGYTGGFTMKGLSLGHKVTHVDSSQGVNTWLLENIVESNLNKDNLKVITDDVMTFVKRIIKRGEKFDIIILDPPAFGHGIKKNDLWKIEKDLPIIIDLIKEILTEKPLSIIMSGYSAGYNAETYKNLLLPFKETFGGEIESDVLCLQEENNIRFLAVGIVARWQANNISK